jgi:uncharacterized protein YidB (DUF937 family)
MSILDNIVGAVSGGGGTNPASAIGDLLNSQDGGLGGLISSFEKGGLGEIAQSWVGKGANLPISAEQIQSVLGSGPLAQVAEKLGIDPQQAATQVSAILPQLIDQLTPDGAIPAGGLGGLGDLLGKFRV